MSCKHCGCDVAAEAQFCPRCGQRCGAEPQAWAPVGGGAPAAFVADPAARLEQNVHLLGLFWCGYGALGLILGSVLAGVVHSWGPHFHGAGPAIGFATGLFSGLALLAGIGLLTRKPWARGLAVFLGVLALFKVPVGTGLGIYTLWVLGGRQGKAQWRRMEMGTAYPRG